MSKLNNKAGSIEGRPMTLRERWERDEAQWAVGNHPDRERATEAYDVLYGRPGPMPVNDAARAAWAVLFPEMPFPAEKATIRQPPPAPA